MRTTIASLLTVAGLALAPCVTDEAVAQPIVPAAGYDAPYYDPAACWDYGWAGAFDMPYCGWYDGYFYPGSGIYVYDHNRQPHIWSDGQHQHWSAQREQWHNASTDGARQMLGGVSGSAVSRPLQPHEMGGGLGGFDGGHFGSYGGHFGGQGGAGGGFGSHGGGHSGRP
jgi:hypothetical protein